MAIPLKEQYHVERERNLKFLVLSLITNLLLPFIHGILFLWIPWFLRSWRSSNSLRFLPYFYFLKLSETFSQTHRIKLFRKDFYFQPSLILTATLHVGLNGFFCIAQTAEINYEPQSYIVSKRLGLISVAQVPAILLFVTKNNFISAISGLPTDKSVFFHKWLGRFLFLSAILHMSLSLQYWIGLKFYIMVRIPPQIFGFIGFSCLGMMNLGSLRFIRNYAFELFLAQHRIFNFIFLLLIYFHNKRARFPVLLGVHLLVLDRIVGRVMGIVHKRNGPTKGKCDFEILDDDTLRVSIPISISNCDSLKWWWCFVPRYGNWRAGQHVLFNCNKVALLAYHPFTVASLPSCGKMVIVIRKKGGFTKKLHNKLQKMAEEKDEESSIQSQDANINDLSSSSSIKKEPFEISTISEVNLRKLVSGFPKGMIYNMKAGINGPSGGNYQPLLKFETVLLFSAGSGSSFTLPVALELLRELEKRNEMNDFLYRPQKCEVEIHATFQKIAHLKWYDHIWSDFYPYLDSGRAKLFLYFTKETYGELELGEKVEDLTMASSQDQSVSDISCIDGTEIKYKRPDVKEIVTKAVRELSSNKYRHSLACLGCGPTEFNYSIGEACDANRWKRDAPEIYCYRESFD